MTKEEYNNAIQTLEQNLNRVEAGIKEAGYNNVDNTWSKSEEGDYLLDAPTPLDAVEMATRCISRNERIPEEIRKDFRFREEVITRVMEIVRNCGLNGQRGEMLKAVKYSPSAMEYVSDRLQNSPDFLLDAIEANKEVAKLDLVVNFCKENPNFAKKVQELSSDELPKKIEGDER